VLGLGVVCALAVAAWVYLLAAHGGFWLTSQRLPEPENPEPVASWPDVVAVIPARDEAAILPRTLPTLRAQDYPGEFSIVLVDDCSTDGTGDLAASLGARLVVRGEPQPAGERWAGKVWAMEQGTRAAGSSEYVLFTDADIAWHGTALKDLVTAAEQDARTMVSQMALLRADSAWERVLVPAFVYFFAQLYPFRKVNNPRSRTAAAAGGCMLVRRDALDKAGGLAGIKDALIDDVALGQLIGGRQWLGLTTDITSVRPYDTLASLWRMVARSAYTQLRYNPILLGGTILGLLVLYAAPPAAAIAGLITGGAVLAALGSAGWALMAVTYLPMLRLYRLSPWRAPTLPFIAVVYAAMTADSAWRYYRGRGGEWKGRVTVSR
jgi:hopene-associated glycosyltransferase HpnB